jgi:hypothetical protein
MRFPRIVAVLGCAVTAACATTANYEKVLDSWLGAPAERLVARWGAPISTFRLPSGNEIYIYDSRRTGVITTPVQVHQGPGMFVGGMYYPGPTTVTGGQAIPFNRWCRTEFTVNPQGTIVQWRWEGNDCVARSPD